MTIEFAKMIKNLNDIRQRTNIRIERSKIHKSIKDADSPFEDEKFIYLIVSKDKIEGSKNRVLRHPKIEKGYVEVKVCTEEGIKIEKITKSQKEKYMQFFLS